MGSWTNEKFLHENFLRENLTTRKFPDLRYFIWSTDNSQKDWVYILILKINGLSKLLNLDWICCSNCESQMLDSNQIGHLYIELCV